MECQQRSTTRGRRWARSVIATATLSLAACSKGSSAPPAEAHTPTASASDAPARKTACPTESGLTLPEGFCATVFADRLGPARHLTVTPSGDVFVAIENGRTTRGKVVALRDADGDGVAEVQVAFSDNGGNGIVWRSGLLYFAQNDRILRYTLPDGQLRPAGKPDVIVEGLPAEEGHVNKTVLFDTAGRLLVNIGSRTNACQVENREPGSPGVDPCPELATRAGVWRFDAERPHQTQAEGTRLATGLRNMVALALEPTLGALLGAQNGRDRLHDSWPDVFSPEDALRLPSEELLRIEEGGDYGWPYCYHDPLRNEMVLAPEYGGDGRTVGRCASVGRPEQAFPAHWAPLGMAFYTGTQFPPRYHHGLFVAHHGANLDLDQPEPMGYRVTFTPFRSGRPAGDFETFATGFAGTGRPLPDEAEHRPVGLAEGPDGALYVSDDRGGRIWRIVYVGQ